MCSAALSRKWGCYIKEQSLDDLFNNLKIYKAEVNGSSASSQNTLNIAFVSSNNTDGTNESVSDVPSVSATSSKATVSTLPNVNSLSDAVIYSFFASQSNSPQLDNEDLKQIDPDDLEKMNLMWQMDMLTMRARRFLKRTRRNLGSSSSSGSDNEVAPCSKACLKAYATLQTHYDNLTVEFRKSQFDVLSYKIGLESVEARLVVYQQNESVFEDDIKLLKLDVILRDNALVALRKKFEKSEKERDELKHTLDKFQTSSKNLSKLLESQVYDKTGLGYDSQVFDREVFDYEELHSDESVNSVPKSLKNDRYTTVPKQKDPSFVQTSEHVKTPRASVKKVKTTKQAKYLRTNNQQSRGQKNNWNKKACFVCRSLNHFIRDCDYYEKQMVQKPVWNSAMRMNHQNSVRMTHPNPNRNVVPKVVLTRSRLVSLNVARPVPTAVPQSTMKSLRPVKHVVNKAHSPIRRPIGQLSATKNSNFNKKVTTVKLNQGNPHQALKDKSVIDSGCLRHMTGNISFLLDFEEINARYVAFGGNPNGGKITGKALYGLYQAPRAWYETLANYLLENGFQRGNIDQTLFIKKQKGDIFLVQVYVDNIIFGSTNKEPCKAFEKLIKDKFQMSSMGELTFFLGLQVKQKDDGIFISQDKYVAKILRKFACIDVKSASTPIETEKPLLKDPDGEDVDVHIQVLWIQNQLLDYGIILCML
nr:putative ribonuclease H-like domain-containing protein [Tanacetum cinerariifolium]